MRNIEYPNLEALFAQGQLQLLGLPPISLKADLEKILQPRMKKNKNRWVGQFI